MCLLLWFGLSKKIRARPPLPFNAAAIDDDTKA